MYRIHLDRSFSEGRGDGQIMPATEYTGHVEWPAMNILPFSWVDTHWLWMKVLREQQSVQDLQVQDEQRDGHRLRRIVWSWAAFDHACLVIDLDRGQPYSFKLKDVYGKPVSSAALRGKVVLISFWATWARACEEEMRQLITWYEQYHGKGLEIVGISLDEDIEDVRWCVEENSLGWPQVLLENYTSWSVLAEVTGVESLPRMFVLDRQGHLREFKKPVDDALILDLLEEPVHNGGAGP